jgi:hypothetical protein
VTIPVHLDNIDLLVPYYLDVSKGAPALLSFQSDELAPDHPNEDKKSLGSFQKLKPMTRISPQGPCISINKNLSLRKRVLVRDLNNRDYEVSPSAILH